ncbi:TetR/AcrR family transcriptional regulator [Xylella fastidiosa]|uniref:TetR/AcrR family transcriptional regulator n=1 Tax=Xylella fastidiosa TaxID=2371 RepID=UPI0003D2F5F9|nr:TetR/AcrR family transcriptional regulator [Xylella fastidiosa]ALR05168.1 TetR/AcrR family transcriptional regulator [Xylella fastidiosa]KXB22306.1 TetR family transcriptional regulator [Xylella fastidiosa]OJZ69350.1 TetR family transcriptional regulator [Xylella fastidiosa 6c]
MARPQSKDKRQMILQTAIQLFAEEGLNAPTARIAKLTPVAEGTIFTYFSTKDELLNKLYLELKSQLRDALVPPPESADLQEQVWMAWQTYVNWGVSHPQEHLVLAKLGLSTRINEATRTEGNRTFCGVSGLLTQAMATGALCNQSPDFVGALMGAMGDVTITFIRANPTGAEVTCRDGFVAFWNAITAK